MGHEVPAEKQHVVKKPLRPLHRLLPFVAPYKWQTFGAVLALIVAAVTVLGIGQGVKFFVDNGLKADSRLLLDEVLIVMLSVVLILSLATYARFYLVSWVGERVIADLRRAVFDHVIRLSPEFFETTNTAEVLSRLTNDTTILQTVLGISFSVALRNSMLFLGGTAMLFITNPRLSGLMFLIAPFVIIPIIVFGKRVRSLSKVGQQKLAEMGIVIKEVVSAIRTVQAFTHEDPESEDFGRHNEGVFQAAVKHTQARAMLNAVVIMLVFGAVSMVLWIGGYDVSEERITGGELSSFVFYAAIVASAIGALSEVAGNLQRASGAADRLFVMLDTRPIISVPEVPEFLPEKAQGAISFHDVYFQYPARPEVPVVSGLSFEIKPGETVAVVGPSGSGKTTIFQLLLRFYDPQKGRILFDGVDIRYANPSAVRARIGIVPQDPVIFSTIAYDNIKYGRLSASAEEVRAAAEAAYVTEFLDRMPDGMNTYLGEGGVMLSGGQRQRIAIARAILKDPPLLLLDEATSALDTESERIVQTALNRLMKNRTTIIIAHNFYTIMKADRILVMEGGRIVESGSHSELIHREGLYARLAALQFKTE